MRRKRSLRVTLVRARPRVRALRGKLTNTILVWSPRYRGEMRMVPISGRRVPSTLYGERGGSVIYVCRFFIRALFLVATTSSACVSALGAESQRPAATTFFFDAGGVHTESTRTPRGSLTTSAADILTPVGGDGNRRRRRNRVLLSQPPPPPAGG